MKRVRILQRARYSRFTPDDRVRAVIREPGEEVEYPDWYAGSLVESGMAEFVPPEAQSEPEEPPERAQKPAEPGNGENPAQEGESEPGEPQESALPADHPFLLIDGVGVEVAAALVAAGYNILEDLASVGEKELLAVPHVGPAKLATIQNYLRRAHLLRE